MTHPGSFYSLLCVRFLFSSFLNELVIFFCVWTGYYFAVTLYMRKYLETSALNSSYLINN